MQRRANEYALPQYVECAGARDRLCNWSAWRRLPAAGLGCNHDEARWGGVESGSGQPGEIRRRG